MQDYRVELETFSGPLDLLLYLVKREEIDLFDIPIGRLTEQYLAYLAKMQQVDVEVAGEFLVMAATLLEIKSAMLVPRPVEGPASDADTGMESLDPRAELVRQLLTYKRFKDLAGELEKRWEEWTKRYPRRVYRARLGEAEAGELEEGVGAEEREFDLEEANVLDLAEAYQRVMESIGRVPADHRVVYDETPIELHMQDIVDRLEREGVLRLTDLFVGRSRLERVGLFVAVLELVRQGRVKVEQDDLASEVRIELRKEEEEGMN